MRSSGIMARQYARLLTPKGTPISGLSASGIYLTIPGHGRKSFISYMPPACGASYFTVIAMSNLRQTWPTGPMKIFV